MKESTETTLPEIIRFRLDVVFATAAMTVLAGLMVPMPLRALDIAWVCSVCLTAAVILICTVAKSCHDLQGFGGLLGIVSLLRLGLIAITVRKILQQQTAGVVVEILGNTVLQTGVITAAILGTLLVFIGGWVVFLAARQIRRSVRVYSDEVLPIKRAGLQADISLQTISREQARTVLEKIRSEMRFFGAIGSISVLMRCEAIAAMVMIVVALGIKAMTDFMAAGYNPELMQSLAAQTAGLAMIAVLPAIASGFSCVALLGKDSLCLQSTPAETADNGKIITLTGTTAESADQVELLNPDFAQKAQDLQRSKEQIVDFEPPKPKEPTVRRPMTAMSPETPDVYYRQLTDLAMDIKVASGQAILLSSLKEVALGVQTAVNTAIGLAGKGHKTLLIDAEPQRSAIAKVFDLNRAATMTSPHKTIIDNLYVFTAGDTESTAAKRTLAAIEQLHTKYEKILIYAPAMAALFADKTPNRMHLLLFVKPQPNQPSAEIPEILTHCASTRIISI